MFKEYRIFVFQKNDSIIYINMQLDINIILILDLLLWLAPEDHKRLND